MNIFEAILPTDAKLTSEHRADLLGGVTTIRVNGGKLTAIPYFAWANRGKTPMNLWLREAE